MKETKQAIITKSSQITLPVRAQRALGVRPGDRIVMTIEDDKVSLSAPRFPTVSSLVGAAGRLKAPLSFKQMREIAYQDRYSSEVDD